MTEREGEPQAGRRDGQAAYDLALQVANVAAQVSAVLRSADEGKRDALEARLALAQARLEERQTTPEGLVRFLDVLQGLLRGDDVSVLAGDLPPSYRAVYEQLVGEIEADEGKSPLTVRKVLDEVTHNVILALTRGTFDQQQQMAHTLLAMERESGERPHLGGLRDLLQSARLLLLGEDPEPVVKQLTGPFKARWEEILAAIEE